MSKIICEQLQAGIIFGDCAEEEYIYLPGGEIGVEQPMCRFESKSRQEDLPIADAVDMVLRLSLKPVIHPRWGTRSY